MTDLPRHASSIHPSIPSNPVEPSGSSPSALIPESTIYCCSPSQHDLSLDSRRHFTRAGTSIGIPSADRIRDNLSVAQFLGGFQLLQST